MRRTGTIPLVSWRFAGAASIARGKPYFLTATIIFTPRVFFPPPLPPSHQPGAERQDRLSITTALGSGASPQVRRQRRRRVAGLRCRNPAPSEPDGTIARHPAQASAALYAARKVRLRRRHALPLLVTPIGSFDAKASSNVPNGSCRSVASLPPRPVGSLHPFGFPLINQMGIPFTPLTPGHPRSARIKTQHLQRPKEFVGPDCGSAGTLAWLGM